ncbi:hypothetical protein CF651_01880 [Paenibacillus rigui]|uniref:TadE-like domain-containing protein n=1 Tax=Paenibacillus rigui TaxID=554312 RepID=A0A229UZ63_9BACL|nr:hypothetical protein CF651_01880 [Paenibacillus rigui]
MRSDEGSIVLEAALVLPLFLSFIFMLIAFVQVSIAEMALQSAVSETTKVVATHMYPVDLLYQQAKGKWEQSAANSWMDRALGQIESVKQTAEDSEQFVEDYERFIPDPVIKLMEWERMHRQQLEASAQAGTEEAKQSIEAAYKPLLNDAVTPIVVLYANKSRLRSDKIKVIHVILPDLNKKDQVFIGIEAQYEVPLIVPFFHKVMVIRKRALERAWIGGTG